MSASQDFMRFAVATGQAGEDYELYLYTSCTALRKPYGVLERSSVLCVRISIFESRVEDEFGERESTTGDYKISSVAVSRFAWLLEVAVEEERAAAKIAKGKEKEKGRKSVGRE
jgi:hypothetical protein